MKTKNYRKTVLSILALTCVGMAMSAHADDAANMAAAKALCGNLVDPNTQQVLNLNGTDGWTASDTNACTSMSMTSTTATPPSATVNQFQCMYHTGQLMTQCMALDAASSTSAMQKVMIDLDYGAAAVCGTACVADFSKAAGMFGVSAYALDRACDITSIGVSGIELIDTFTQNSSAVGKTVDSLFAGAGIAGGIEGLRSASTLATGATKAGTSTTSKIMSCGTAALMAIEGALRKANFGAGETTQQQAANAIAGLNSLSPTAGGATTPTLLTQNSGGSGVNIAGSMGANSITGTGVSPTGVSCAQNGMGTTAGGCGLTAAQIAASPDAALLNGPLGAQAAQAALANPDLGNQLSSGSAPPAANGAPSLQPLGDLAKTTIENAKELGAVGGDVNMVATGSAAPLSSETGSLDFGSHNTNPTAPAAAQITFGKATPTAAINSTDIWHKGYKGSIFTIVSKKIVSSASLVDTLPWSTPMNRALAGNQAPATSGAQK